MQNYKYLRISVTDKCDLSCKYCKAECSHSCNREPFSFEDILKAVKVLRGFGIFNLRMTGGEPLLRKDLPSLIDMLTPHCSSIAITTNGTRLKNMAKDLRMAGLSNINVHIDTLDSHKFKFLTGGDAGMVFEGIETAKKAGMTVKLNTVLLRGINDDETGRLIEYAAKLGAPIRFIELMPFCTQKFYREHFIPTDHILKGRKFVPITQEFGNGPAEYYKDEITGGIVGCISPLTRKFCGSCDRLRLTHDGLLKRCLADTQGLDLQKCLFDKMEISKYLLAKEYNHKNFIEAGAYSLRSLGG